MSQPRQRNHRPASAQPQTLQWLLEAENPPVRYLTLTQLLSKPARHRDVSAARRAIAQHPPVRQSLKKLRDVPTLEPVDLSVLAMVGLSRQDPDVDHLCQRVMDGCIRRQRGYGCYIGHILGSLIRLGYWPDPRLDPLVSSILQEQRFLDGNRPGTELRFGRLSSVCAGAHSCFSAVTWTLWALLAIPPKDRSSEIKAFLQRGADFLRAHRLYQHNHSAFTPVRSEWMKLQLPFGLGWRTSVLHILDVAGQLGLTNDPACADAVALILSRQNAQGRWPLELRNPDRTTGCAPLWQQERVGRASKWITLTALTQLHRFRNLVSRLEETPTTPDTADKPTRHTEFADYPFAHDPAEEQHVTRAWADTGLQDMLHALLTFATRCNLLTGWHDGLVLGPPWCREWCSATPAWVPRPRYARAWPVCRLFFLARRGQWTDAALADRLQIPVTDVKEKSQFPHLYRHAFWRIQLAAWNPHYDEIALALRSTPELSRALDVLAESLQQINRQP